MAEAQSSSSANSKVMVVSPTEKDVLFGRGKPVNSHEGNRRFRELVNARQDEYTGSTRQWKSEVVNDIYEKIHSLGGRFLKQVENKKMRKGDRPRFFEADKEDALEKIRQALRENRTRRDASSGGERQHTSETLPSRRQRNPPIVVLEDPGNGLSTAKCRKAESRDKETASTGAMTEAPPSPTIGRVVIATPTSNDVLFGRGKAANNHEGNWRFRELVTERKDEYTGSTRHWKSEVVNDIYDKIHSMGGRFLKHAEDENVREGGKPGFCEAHKEDALEKIRQALREIQPNRDASRGGQNQHASEALSSWHRAHPIVPDMSVNNLVPPANSMVVLPGGMLSRQVATSLARNAPVALFLQQHNIMDQVALNSATGSASFSLNRGAGAGPVPMDTKRLACPQNGHQSMITSGSTPASHQHGSAVISVSSRVLSPLVDSVAPTQDSASMQISHNGQLQRGRFTSEQDALSDAEVSNLLVQSIIGDPNRPRFTEEQAQVELASLSPQERESALCDMFGRSCTIHQTKRAKRELDELSMRLLVKETRHELERIPNDRKRALVEAQAKSSAEEFSDSRLLQFLRCEGMDSKLGAERFVRYWECRREVFGSEKYTQRMTLSEALKDDLVALETGFCYLLPSLDISGRQILFRDPSRHTREGYTSDSLLRAYWYVVEVCSRENTDINSGIVTIAWNGDTTIWDYDRKVWERTLEFDRMCWPVKSIAWHNCCPSSFLVQLLKPFIFVILDKDLRSRVMIHNVPASQLPDALAEYGILKHMLPTTMGGSLEFSPADFIANRRAAELEEL